MKAIHIEAEAYTAMSGVTTEPTKDAGGGNQLAYIDSGDWAEYALNIDTAGTYLINFRFAKPYTDFSTIDVISNNNVIGTVPIKVTKDWQKWDATGTNITLAAGQQTLRLRFTSGNFNLNWFELTLVSEATQQAPAAANKAGAQSVDSFTLINATNNQDIQTIANGSTLNLATLGRSLNIRANTSPSDVGSVVFSLTGAQSKTQTETVAPYALFGDNNGVYLGWTPVVGNYVLTATPTRGAQGNGPQGNALAVSFTVTDVPVVKPVPPIPTVPPVTPPPVVNTPTPQPQPIPVPPITPATVPPPVTPASAPDTSSTGKVPTPTPAPNVPPVVTPTPPPVVNTPVPPVTPAPQPSPTPAPTPTTGKTAGEIPFLPYWGFAMDNSTQDFTGFFDGDLTKNVNLGDSKMTDRPDIVFQFPAAMEVELDEVWFGDGQHEQSGVPMQSWTIDTVTKQKVAAFTFDGKNPFGTWQKNKFAKTTRTDHFVMQWTYPIPTQMKFIGKYKPFTPKPYTMPKIPVEAGLGAVVYSWDLQKPSAMGLDATKNVISDTCGLFRLYFDMGMFRMPTGLYTFQPCCQGAWQTDAVLADLNARGKKVLLCLKGQEAAPYYPEAAEQIAIRYGNNANIPDSKTKLFLGPGWPGNVIKKGLNANIAIQLGNEQWRWWKGRCNVAAQTNLEGYMTPFETAAQFKLCYDKIKAVDPTIEVVLGGMPANTPGILQGIIHWCNLYNNGQLCFDSVSYHEYLNESNGGQNVAASPKGAEPERFNYAMFNHVARFKQVLSEASPNKEIKLYITETGYSIANINLEQTAVPTKAKNTFIVQADWSLRSYFEGLAAGLAGITFYQLYDDLNYMGKPQVWMPWDLSNGIAQQNKDGNVGLRPTTDAFGQMTKLLKGYVLESRDISNPLIIVYKFTKAGANTVYALHKVSHDDSTAPYSLKVTGASVKQYSFNFGTMSKEKYFMDGTTQVWFDAYTKGTGVLDMKIINSLNGLVSVLVEETPKFIEII